MDEQNLSEVHERREESVINVTRDTKNIRQEPGILHCRLCGRELGNTGQFKILRILLVAQGKIRVLQVTFTAVEIYMTHILGSIF